MTKRVAVLAIYHETNTFSPIPTTTSEFARRWYRGPELTAQFADTNTVVGGMLEGAKSAGLDAIPILGAFATPSGLVHDEVCRQIEDEIRCGLRECGDVDGVLLELHGAMVADGRDDVEEEILAWIRDEVGEVPIGAVVDMHANLGQQRLEAIDILLGYQTNPHVDTAERGRRCAELLARVMSGDLRPYRAHRAVPILVPPTAQGTADSPMAHILEEARRLLPQVDDISVLLGFAYADVHHAGMSVLVTADQSSSILAEAHATTISDVIRRHEGDFRTRLRDPDDAFARASESSGMAAVADTGDNVNGGSTGAGTWLLQRALTFPEVRVLSAIWDPDLVRSLKGTPVGTTLEVAIAGRTGRQDGPAISAAATVLSRSTGEFINEGPMAAGARWSMGDTIVLRLGNSDLVVQSHAVQPNDPAMFRSQGLEPATYDVVLLKGATALRAAWGALATAVIPAGTRGVTDADLSRLSYFKTPDGTKRAPAVLDAPSHRDLVSSSPSTRRRGHPARLTSGEE